MSTWTDFVDTDSVLLERGTQRNGGYDSTSFGVGFGADVDGSGAKAGARLGRGEL
jgi:hypothetical protein